MKKFSVTVSNGQYENTYGIMAETTQEAGEKAIDRANLPHNKNTEDAAYTTVIKVEDWKELPVGVEPTDADVD